MVTIEQLIAAQDKSMAAHDVFLAHEDDPDTQAEDFRLFNADLKANHRYVRCLEAYMDQTGLSFVGVCDRIDAHHAAAGKE